MTITADKDLGLQSAVQDELVWTPDVDAAGIGVAVEDGTVSLSGEVDDNSERLAAKRAALRVRGVTAVVDNLTVHPRASFPITNTDIAKQVDRALSWANGVPDTVKAEIDGHTVTLRGQVGWNYQRDAARKAVQHLRGVYTVKNSITLTPRPTVKDTQQRIKAALTRNALLDAKKVNVRVEGSEVILTGTVQSWAEKQQAGHAAWSSPHVDAVDNRIEVRVP